jgi:hypothetical protein
LKHFFTYIVIFSLLAGCGNNNEEVPWNSSSLFERAEGIGEAPHTINEASGLAGSIANPEQLWTHNDSGGEPRVFLINKKAEIVAIVTLEGVENRDWEDITVGKGPQSDTSYLYIAEIGDNRSIHATKYVYRFPEPKIDSITSTPVLLTISDFDRIPIKYSDGKRDAETLFIDDARDLYIVSKREANVNVYVVKYPQRTDTVNVLTRLGSLPIHNVVSGDISNNNEILLKTYDNVYYWKIVDGQSVHTTLSHTPTLLSYKPEPQGEAICWAPNGNGYFTLGEKNGTIIPKLLYYKRR